MLNLPQQTLDKIKKILLKKQHSVEAQIKELDKEDPVLYPEGVDEASESGTESWQAEVHNRLQTIKNDLLDLSKRIKKSLFRIKTGTYGKCEKCHKDIEKARLEAMPTATLCVACSKKPSKR